jgi:hypothetical protein
VSRRFILTHKAMFQDAGLATLSNAAFRFLAAAIFAADEDGLLLDTCEEIAEKAGCCDGHFTTEGPHVLRELLEAGIMTGHPPDDVRFTPKYFALLNGVSVQRPGFVYFVEAESGGPIKIGWAASVKKRVAELQTASHSRLVVLATKAGTRLDETALHDRFRNARLRGEWFEPVPELLELIHLTAKEEMGGKP